MQNSNPETEQSLRFRLGNAEDDLRLARNLLEIARSDIADLETKLVARDRKIEDLEGEIANLDYALQQSEDHI